MEKTKSYANGKLLITGEYLVLEGALALAVPTIYGQELTIQQGSESGMLHWQSHYDTKKWFEATFTYPGIDILACTDAEAAAFIRLLMLEAIRLSSHEMKAYPSLAVSTRLGFHPDWGLGSSSSLISNLAAVFGIDPFELFFNTQKGSGYDIACARAGQAIFYRLDEGRPLVEPAGFSPPFAGQLALVYSGRKQNSAESLGRYLKNGRRHEYEKGSISAISREMAGVSRLNEFKALIDEHEKIMSGVLGMPTVKEAQFAGFPGSIKSLGAWGGDFLLVASEFDINQIKAYFSKYGLELVFKYEELFAHAGSRIPADDHDTGKHSKP